MRCSLSVTLKRTSAHLKQNPCYMMFWVSSVTQLNFYLPQESALSVLILNKSVQKKKNLTIYTAHTCILALSSTHSIHIFTICYRTIIIDSFYSTSNRVQRHGVTWPWWTAEKWVFCPQGHAVQLWSEIIAKQKQKNLSSHTHFGDLENLSEELKKTRLNKMKQVFGRKTLPNPIVTWERNMRECKKIRAEMKGEWEEFCEEKEEIPDDLADSVYMKNLRRLR